MGGILGAPKWAMWGFYLSLVDCVRKEAEQLLVSLLREAKHTTADCDRTGKGEGVWERVV